MLFHWKNKELDIFFLGGGRGGMGGGGGGRRREDWRSLLFASILTIIFANT